jgi:enamine deaminase RidA (YjgF/YER057c/UK114 family)
LSVIEEKLEEMGLALPMPAKPAGNYVPAVVTGNLVFLSGQIPRNSEGNPISGILGDNCSVQEGYEIARDITLSLLSTLKTVIGDLDKINRFVKLVCMVNATQDFNQHPSVANGASDLLVALLGENGKHARVAAGMGSLPAGVPVEIDLIVELK